MGTGNGSYVMGLITKDKKQRTKKKGPATPHPSPPTPSLFTLYTLGLAPRVYTNFPVGTWPESVAIGDVNGDGHDDLAVANQNSNMISILSATGAAVLAPTPPSLWETVRIPATWETSMGMGSSTWRWRTASTTPDPSSWATGVAVWNPNQLPRRSCSYFRQRGRLKRGWQR